MRLGTFLLVMLASVTAHAQTFEHMGNCGRWSGGTLPADDEGMRHRADFGVQLTFILGRFHFRSQDHRKKEFGEFDFEWSPWVGIGRDIEVEDGGVLMYVADEKSYFTYSVMFVKATDDGRLYGKLMRLPIVRDRDQDTFRSVAEQGERYVWLECIRPLIK